MPKKVHLLLVASSGGHLKELYCLKEFWQNYDRTWVTFPNGNAQGQLQDEKNIIYAAWPTQYPNLLNNIKNAFLALKTVLSGKYTHILSTGAGVGVPFIWFGWLLSPFLKTKTIFIDSLTRTENMSFSLKLVYYFSHIRLTQWEHLIKKFPRLLFKGRVI